MGQKVSVSSCKSSGCKEETLALNRQLRKRCEQKIHHLRQCSKCGSKNKKWPQINTVFDAYLLNTAHNGAGGQLDSGSGHDPIWEFGYGTDLSSVTTWMPAHVYRDNAWSSSPYANANWITNNSDGSHQGNIDIFFRVNFYLHEHLDLADFELELSLLADNSVHDIYLNGVSLASSLSAIPQAPSNPHGYVGFNADNEAKVNLYGNWKECENQITIHVKSGADRVGLLAGFGSLCRAAKLPSYRPEIKVKWGVDRRDDLLKGCNVLCISVCNSYDNLVFSNYSINYIEIIGQNGKPINSLYADVVPKGEVCFGDIPPCSCVSREIVLMGKKLRPENLRIKMGGICYEVYLAYKDEACFYLSRFDNEVTHD